MPEDTKVDSQVLECFSNSNGVYWLVYLAERWIFVIEQPFALPFGSPKEGNRLDVETQSCSI